MGNVVREFMTHWNDKGPIWFERDEDELVGTQRSGGRPIPRIRMVDLFRGYTTVPGNRPVVVWLGQEGVIEGNDVPCAEVLLSRHSINTVLFYYYTVHSSAMKWM